MFWYVDVPCWGARGKCEIKRMQHGASVINKVVSDYAI